MCVAASVGRAVARVGAGRDGEFRDGVEGLVEGVAGDVFVVDFDAFEEGLVEQAALGCVCL